MMSWVYLAVSARPRRPSRATSQENLMKLERITTQPDPYEPFLLSQGIRLSDLEHRVSLNPNVLDAHHTPRVMGLKEVLTEWLKHTNKATGGTSVRAGEGKDR